jgi:hypothetical protein
MAGRLVLAAVPLPFWFAGQSNLDQAANFWKCHFFCARAGDPGISGIPFVRSAEV